MIRRLFAKLNIWLLLSFLFVFPFQTRLVYAPNFLNGGFWEYGSASLYGSELLLLFIIILTAWEYFSNRVFWQKLLMSRQRLDKMRAGVRAGIFVFILFLTIINSRDRYVSLIYLGYFIDGLCLGGVIVLSRAAWRQKLLAFWLGGILQSVLAISQFIFQEVIGSKWLGMAGHSAADLGASVVESNGRFLRAYGSFSWPNALGIYLVIVFLLGLILYLKTPDPPRRIWLIVGQTLILFALFFSWSRAAWLGVFVGVLVMVIIWLKNRSQENVIAMLWPLIHITITLGTLAMIFWPLLSVRFLSAGNLERRSLDERYGQVQDWRKIIQQNPFLGVGPGVYTAALSVDNPNRPVWQYQPIHNIYLLFFAEWGAIISSFFFLMLGWHCRRIFFFEPLLIGVVAAWLVFGFFDHWSVSLYAGLILSGAVFGLTWPIDADKNQQ